MHGSLPIFTAILVSTFALSGCVDSFENTVGSAIAGIGDDAEVSVDGTVEETVTQAAEQVAPPRPVPDDPPAPPAASSGSAHGLLGEYAAIAGCTLGSLNGQVGWGRITGGAQRQQDVKYWPKATAGMAHVGVIVADGPITDPCNPGSVPFGVALADFHKKEGSMEQYVAAFSVEFSQPYDRPTEGSGPDGRATPHIFHKYAFALAHDGSLYLAGESDLQIHGDICGNGNCDVNVPADIDMDFSVL